MHCTDLDEHGSPTFNVVEVTLAPGAMLHRPARERTETISSACGVCGSATIDAVRTSSRYAVAEDPSSSHPEVLAGLPEALRARQPVFDRTGGVHAAALATPDGELLVVREDVGRHNAVDKVVGRRGPRPRAAVQRNRARRQRPGKLRDRAEGERRRHPGGRGGGGRELARGRAGDAGRHHPRRVRAAAALVRLQPPRPAARRGVSAGTGAVASDAIGRAAPMG